MPKSDVVRPARFKQGRLRADELPDAVEGQIAEICCDFAVQLSLVTSGRRANYLMRRRTARRVRAVGCAWRGSEGARRHGSSAPGFHDVFNPGQCGSHAAPRLS